MALKGTELVEKRNILNEAVYEEKMWLQEIRFFSAYLGKINPRDQTTRVVRFKLKEFQDCIGKGDANLKKTRETTDRLLRQIAHVPLESGGFHSFQLFSECKVDRDKKGEWYVELVAHEKAMPFMFGFIDRYFSYRLSNVLRLLSTNQVHLYEQLKQYEGLGVRTIPIEQLRKILEIGDGQYTRWDNFRQVILLACQKALSEKTDICFTFEPVRVGRSHETVAVKFFIKENTDFLGHAALFESVPGQRNSEHISAKENVSGASTYEERVSFLVEACNKEFSKEEIIVLWDVMQRTLPDDIIFDERRCYDYLSGKYHEMIMRDKKKKIQHRFNYLKSMIGKDDWLSM